MCYSEANWLGFMVDPEDLINAQMNLGPAGIIPALAMILYVVILWQQ